MYKVIIEEIYTTKSPRKICMQYESNLSFAPFPGLIWVDEDNDIYIKVEDVRYINGVFYVTVKGPKLDEEELTGLIKERQELGWDIQNYGIEWKDN